MICPAANEPNIFLKITIMAGGPSQVLAMELATTAKVCVALHLVKS